MFEEITCCKGWGLIILDLVMHLSMGLELVFYKLWVLCIIMQRKNYNFRLAKLNLCTN